MAREIREERKGGRDGGLLACPVVAPGAKCSRVNFYLLVLNLHPVLPLVRRNRDEELAAPSPPTDTTTQSPHQHLSSEKSLSQHHILHHHHATILTHPIRNILITPHTTCSNITSPRQRNTPSVTHHNTTSHHITPPQLDSLQATVSQPSPYPNERYAGVIVYLFLVL